MQQRHLNRNQYFNELKQTSTKYFIPYLQETIDFTPQHYPKVLEVGCGDGGNLFPFAEMGCSISGFDLSAEKIENARRIFSEKGIDACLQVQNLFDRDVSQQYNLILLHDVFEHLHNKAKVLEILSSSLEDAPNRGVLFVAFPAWQMPFGGHQQILKNKFLSHVPFMHLLPQKLYKKILKASGTEEERTIEELLDVKECRVSIEYFRKLIARSSLKIIDERFYLINPHYEVKFNLRPRRLNRFLGGIPYVRNFFTTTCFYLLTKKTDI